MGKVDQLAFTGADAQWLAVGSQNEIRIFDGRTLSLVRSMPTPSELVAMGGSEPDPSLAVVFSDTIVCRFDVTSKPLECDPQGFLRPDGGSGVRSTYDCHVEDCGAARLLAITDFDFGRRIGDVNIDTSIALWDATRKRGQLLPLRSAIKPKNTRSAGARPVRKLDAGKQQGWEADDADINIFALSPDRRKLASNGGGTDNGMNPRLVLWDLERGTVIASQQFTDAEVDISSIAFGEQVIVTADDSSIRLFDASTLTPLGEKIELDGSKCFAFVSADDTQAGALCAGGKAFACTMDIREWRKLALRRANISGQRVEGR